MKTFIKITIFFIIILVLNVQKIFAEEKIRIGLLVPLSGQNKEIGKSIVKSTRLAINKINNSSIEILPRDTASNPDTTFGTQFIGTASVCIFSFALSWATFTALKSTIGLRISKAAEKLGTDKAEVGVSAYSIRD